MKSKTIIIKLLLVNVIGHLVKNSTKLDIIIVEFTNLFFNFSLFDPTTASISSHTIIGTDASDKNCWKENKKKH